MMNIESLILAEEEKLKLTTSGSDRINILFNLICLKNEYGDKRDYYINIKNYILTHIELFNISNYGYDNFNYNKFNTLLNLLKPEEKGAMLQFAISTFSRELPEHDREWFVMRKHEVEIENIFFYKKKAQYIKAILLYAGHKTNGLIITLSVFLIFTNILLLPAFSPSFAFFSISYENYSEKFVLNHFFNILTLFADIDNNFNIQPLNWIGVIMIIIGKLLFILFIVNFVYIKITDKITMK